MNEMTLQDRVEFALRDAGFDLDEAANLAAHLAKAGEPAQPVEADSDRTKLIDSVRYLRHRWMAATRHDGHDGDFDILLEVIDRLKRDADLAKPQKPVEAVDERAAFADWYVKNALDLEKQPVSCRECGLQWEAWQAALSAQAPSVAVGELEKFADQWEGYLRQRDNDYEAGIEHGKDRCAEELRNLIKANSHE